MFENSKLLREVRKNDRGSHFIIELIKFFFVIFTVTYFANRAYSFVANRNLKPFSTIPGLWNDAMILLAVGAVLYCLLWEKLNLRQLGIIGTGCKKSFVDYALGLGFGCLMIALIAGVLFLTGGLQFAANFPNVRGGTFVLLLFSYLLQGFGEEALFRSAFLLSAARKNKPIIAILMTSVFFSLWHYKTVSYGVLPFINLFLFGVFCAVCVFVYDNIWVSGAFHAAWNFVQAHLFGVCVSGSAPSADSTLFIATAKGGTVLSGGSYGIEGSLITSVALALAIAALVLYDKNRKK